MTNINSSRPARDDLRQRPICNVCAAPAQVVNDMWRMTVDMNQINGYIKITNKWQKVRQLCRNNYECYFRILVKTYESCQTTHPKRSRTPCPNHLHHMFWYDRVPLLQRTYGGGWTWRWWRKSSNNNSNINILTAYTSNSNFLVTLNKKSLSNKGHRTHIVHAFPFFFCQFECILWNNVNETKSLMSTGEQMLKTRVIKKQ